MSSSETKPEGTTPSSSSTPNLLSEQSPRPRPPSSSHHGTAPPSPILTTTLNSPRFGSSNSVRFSHGSEIFPSLGSQGSISASASASGSSSDHTSSNNTSPVPGPVRPAMASRASSRQSGSGYTSAVSYKRPVSSGSTLFARKAWPSTKLKGEIEKPWVKYPDPAHRWGKIIFWVLVALGFVAGAASRSFLG